MRHALEAIELMTVVFGGGSREDLKRLEAHRAAPPGEGTGAKMLASISAFYWSNTGGPAAKCVELARAALADDVLIKHDNGLYWVTANVVLVYADDERALEVWEAARREAHRNGSLFAILSVNLWRGWNLLRWGELPEAEESLLAAAEEMSLWGSEAGTVNEYPAAFLAETRIERGDLAGARAAIEALGQVRRQGRRRQLLARRHGRVALQRGQARGGARGLRRLPRGPDAVHEPDPAPLEVAARARSSTASGAARRGSSSPPRRSSWRASGARLVRSAARFGCRGR